MLIVVEQLVQHVQPARMEYKIKMRLALIVEEQLVQHAHQPAPTEYKIKMKPALIVVEQLVHHALVVVVSNFALCLFNFSHAAF